MVSRTRHVMLFAAFPRARRVGQGRANCCWLDKGTNCDTEPQLFAVEESAAQPWQPVQKVQQYTLSSTTVTR